MASSYPARITAKQTVCKLEMEPGCVQPDERPSIWVAEHQATRGGARCRAPPPCTAVPAPNGRHRNWMHPRPAMSAPEWGRGPPLPAEPPPPLPPEAWGAGPAASYPDHSQRSAYRHDAQLDAFGRPLGGGPAAVQRQRLPPDQRTLYMQSAGSGKAVKRDGAPQPAPGAKAARRAAAAAAAAQLAALPATASGDYLDAYPAVKQLMQRFK